MSRKSIPIADEIYFDDDVILKYTNKNIILYVNPNVKDKIFKVVNYESYTTTALFIGELEIMFHTNNKQYDEIAKTILFNDFSNEFLMVYDNFGFIYRTF